MTNKVDERTRENERLRQAFEVELDTFGGSREHVPSDTWDPEMEPWDMLYRLRVALETKEDDE